MKLGSACLHVKWLQLCLTPLLTPLPCFHSHVFMMDLTKLDIIAKFLELPSTPPSLANILFTILLTTNIDFNTSVKTTKA